MYTIVLEQGNEAYVVNSAFTDPGDQFIGRVALFLRFVPDRC